MFDPGLNKYEVAQVRTTRWCIGMIHDLVPCSRKRGAGIGLYRVGLNGYIGGRVMSDLPRCPGHKCSCPGSYYYTIMCV